MCVFIFVPVMVCAVAVNGGLEGNSAVLAVTQDARSAGTYQGKGGCGQNQISESVFHIKLVV